MRSRDTSRTAEEIQRDIYRRMTVAQRFDQVLSLVETGRELARAGIRRRHPEYTVAQVESAMLRLVLGDDLYRRAWPSRPVLDP